MIYRNLYIDNQNEGEVYMQKVIVVNGYWHNSNGKWKDTTEELNGLLAEGWKVVNIAPMGAYGFGYDAMGNTANSDHGFASIVVIEK